MPAGRAVATAATTAADATAATGCAASAGGAGDHASPFRPREAHPGTVLQNLQKQRNELQNKQIHSKQALQQPQQVAIGAPQPQPRVVQPQQRHSAIGAPLSLREKDEFAELQSMLDELETSGVPLPKGKWLYLRYGKCISPVGGSNSGRSMITLSRSGGGW